MKHHLEIRIDLETKPGCSVGDWEEYRDNFISKIRSAHDWNSFNRVILKKCSIYESDERTEVTEISRA